ncbi:envelope stress response membrane protein PspB [Sphingomonas bacterium]|uniref:envelope stress response membrane protein PspB n=1 Tax=Sphingomonas bacterium TaxID=1895847 RepID=UPI00157647A1|nr:envelope stress response membrane protein PspB [Sphingomonas bacterium]
MHGNGIVAILATLIGLPWIILHYITKWRSAPKITDQDERLLDEMFNLARRLEERVQTVERIAQADHPDWKPGLSATTPSYRIERSN